MRKTNPHTIHTGSDDTDAPKRAPWDNRYIASVHPASKESIAIVAASEEGSFDGRSEFLWLRLANGDLMLGVFPRGDTYLAVEGDAQYPD